MTITEVGAPYALEITKRGELVVTEKNLHRVSVFSLSGERLRSFGSSGANQGQFHGPRGVTVDGEGNILVSDSHNDRIQKFTADGKFLMAVGTGEGDDEGQFDSPAGITCDSTGKVYVVDSFNHRIQVFTATGNFLSAFGSFGTGPGN